MYILAIIFGIVCIMGIAICVLRLIEIAKDLEKHKYDPSYFPADYITMRKKEDDKKEAKRQRELFKKRV